VLGFRSGGSHAPWTTVLNRPEVLRFFATHDWVASCHELAEIGVNKAALSRARRSGTAVAILPRVVTLPDAELTFYGRCRALVLWAGGEAFVSGPSAGHLLGLRGMPHKRIEITTKFQHRMRAAPQWGKVVRTSWLVEPRDVATTAGGLRIATPLRTLFGLASQFNDHRFERAAEDVWHLGLVSPPEASVYLAEIRRSGRGGVRRFERWLQHVERRERPSHSGLELDMLAIVASAGLPQPVRQFPLVLPSGETIHLDLAWPDLRLAVEPGHSWWHGGDLRQRRDAGRDHACAAIGWAVYRFDEVQIAAREEATLAIASIYRERHSMLPLTRSVDSESR